MNPPINPDEQFAVAVAAKTAAHFGGLASAKVIATAAPVLGGSGLILLGAGGIIDENSGIALGLVIGLGGLIWAARGVYDRLGVVEREVKDLKKRVRAVPCDACGHTHA